MKYDFIVVGSGFAGATVAERLASKYNKKVLVVEKRNHIGGNMYDEFDEYGFLIQKYGPHLFFTNSDIVLDYVGQFDELVQHDCFMLSEIEGKYIQLPFNFKSVEQMLGYKEARIIIDCIRKNYDCSKRISIYSLMDSNNKVISEFGHFLYKKAFETYICKQWGIKPNDISKDVIDRCKFSPNYVSRYLDKDFQYMPRNGFTYLISKMLENHNITVELNVDANSHISIINNKVFYDNCCVPIIYTGSIDSLLDFKYGKLPYRSLSFETNYYFQRKKLPAEIISQPSDPYYIRKTEYKYFSPFIVHTNEDITVVVSEKPYQYDYSKNSIQCYPIINDNNNRIYKYYYDELSQIKNLFLVGRLAEYKYYNMDYVILNALNLADCLGEDENNV
ncbi:MAG: UDP-galactopyranose mutase [Clostridia bacterium]|nr:UDP-galactopyranose mutase [Clostridia bacterium]